MPKQPNIVLFNCDDLGFGDLGCYGSTLNDTPVIDRMAAEGLRLTSFYVASPVCSPSRGSLMTGCYPKRVGFDQFEGKAVLFPGQGVGLNPEEVTIAKLLQTAGYHTLHIGKWHCGDQPQFLPTRHGFDHYYGLPYSNDMGMQAGRVNRYPPLPLLADEEVLQEQPDQASLAERYMEQAIRFIRKSGESPFFLYFAPLQVHLPLYAPSRFVQQSRNGDYGAAVACIDWCIEVLLSELKRLSLAEDTLVVFMSDNGSRGDHGGSNAPLRGAKTTTWEGGMRVPCIAYWPGRIQPGNVSDEIVAALDWYPTFARLAGIELPDRTIDGLDITDFLLQVPSVPSPRQVMFYYHKDAIEAVRDGKWKLHVGKIGEPFEALFDLEQDTGETDNVWELHPNVVARLKQLIAKCGEELGDRAAGLPGTNIRKIGQVERPSTLTHVTDDHPYMCALYDKPEFG
ncbi:Cerebroside-sulfatase [Paenibacillus swuensis]|uniref:Cerebroside-sulfatase n=1 Tax=Paenibacillus swuensis TaxID=1178515 RepID=A0A172TJE1_9BACL|nr:sulfatase [Paenibacillus swuensis]ANE47086.1 Cerebroside-sulfatase [Paenibacillus swuensis]